MAKTEGAGNPDWSREETLLALNLYFEAGGIVPSGTDERVVALSKFLQSLALHLAAARRPSFRNPDGVAFKIGNLRSVATGKGLKNVSSVDRAIWEEFGSKPNEVRLLAEAIRRNAATSSTLPDSIYEDEAEEFAEGRTLTRVHKQRERNRRVRKKLLESRKKAGLLHCEACGRVSTLIDAAYDSCEFEAHHKRPIAEGSERKTLLADMALLCACCHRLIHAMMVRTKRFVSLDELRVAVAGRSHPS